MASAFDILNETPYSQKIIEGNPSNGPKILSERTQELTNFIEELIKNFVAEELIDSKNTEGRYFVRPEGPDHQPLAVHSFSKEIAFLCDATIDTMK